MDEPTSSLNSPEVQHLFSLISDLKAQGCGIVYITHKMEEIERIADRITVLRDGCLVGTALASELPPAKLVHWMVGREMGEQFQRIARTAGKERLRLENFCAGWRSETRRWTVENISLTLRAGEILGVAGVQGSGNSELFQSLFGGIAGPVKGQVLVDDLPFRICSPRHSIEQGMQIVNSYPAAVVFCIITMLCWGSWANTQKLASKEWRFQLFYWDYAIGVLLLSLILAFTMGSTGAEGRGFLADLKQADNQWLWSAFVGGVIFNLSNILLVAAIDIAGLAVAFPVGVGLALVLGVITTYFSNREGNVPMSWMRK